MILLNQNGDVIVLEVDTVKAAGVTRVVISKRDEYHIIDFYQMDKRTDSFRVDKSEKNGDEIVKFMNEFNNKKDRNSNSNLLAFDRRVYLGY